MILRPDTQLIEDMNSLKIVFSVDTNGLHHGYCTPGIFNKTYLNRHIFKGLHQDNNKGKVNEIFNCSKQVYLTDSQEGTIGTRDQLFKLFYEYDFSGTFGYLNTVVSDAIVGFKIHQKLNIGNYKPFSIDKKIYEDVTDYMFCNGTLHQPTNLPELITSTTYQLLKNSRLPI